MTLIQFIGINSSIKIWENKKISSMETAVNNIIEETYKSEKFSFDSIINKLQYAVTGTNTVIVYDKDKNLVSKIEKTGLRRKLADIQKESFITSKPAPIYYNNVVEGYYAVSFLSYKSEEENLLFFNNSIRSFLIGTILYLIIASLFALYYSKSLSLHSKKVAYGIDQISRGYQDFKIEEKGLKEISLIAKSVNMLNENLKREKKIRDQWAQDIAHDLRTPIAALKAQMEAIKDKVLDFSVERIDKNLTELNKIEMLINDLSNLIKLESPELKLEFETIKINDFIHDIISNFDHIIKEKNINLVFKTRSKEMTADKNLLERALKNIINNALQYTLDYGKVKIDVFRKENLNVINIFNSHSYIKKDEIDKIFDRLYRGEFARNTSGTGLGLTIAKRIIELHKGEISVKSIRNKGTTFIIKW